MKYRDLQWIGDWGEGEKGPNALTVWWVKWGGKAADPIMLSTIIRAVSVYRLHMTVWMIGVEIPHRWKAGVSILPALLCQGFCHLPSLALSFPAGGGHEFFSQRVGRSTLWAPSFLCKEEKILIRRLEEDKEWIKIKCLLFSLNKFNSD